MLSVQTNLLAQNANRNLKVNTGKNAKITEKLSSGYKINRAADDASGLSMSEKMRRQVRGLHQSEDNINEGVGYVQTAEGALNEVQDILQRINELSVKAANGTNTPEDREYIDQEIQQFKKEMTRIFAETTFNEQKIWEPRERRVLGYEEHQAVEFNGSRTSRSYDVANNNCGIIPYGGYKVNADKDKGVWVTWTGYDGNKYETKKIDWKTLKEKNYSFDISDYFGTEAEDANNKLLYIDGDPAKGPVITQQISFSPQETATIDDIVDGINDKTYSVGTSAYAYARFEDKDKNAVSKTGVSIYANDTLYDYSRLDMYYPAYYASNHNTGTDEAAKNNGTADVHDFDKADDDFLEPADKDGKLIQNSTTTGGNLTKKPTVTGTTDAAQVASAKDSSEGWEFSFYMDGIGTVKAASTSIVYYAPSDTSPDDEQLKGKNDCWWKWISGYRNGVYVEQYEQRAVTRTVSTKGAGTLGSAMAALYGDKTSSKPGLLTAADNGGYIEIHFSLRSDKEYEYGWNENTNQKLTSNYVGSFKLKIRVNNTDSEKDVLDRIQNALNDNTILDIYTDTSGSNADRMSVTTPSANKNMIDVPIYGGICGFYVQGGTESGQHISIQYESLSLLALGMADTNVLTQESAGNAINEVKAALQIVSKQRSDFGAYQNRLEHAYNINSNVEENTQASESVIRDTDIAEMVMEHSVNNILLQAGTSMLTQANQSKQSVLELLQ